MLADIEQRVADIVGAAGAGRIAVSGSVSSNFAGVLRDGLELVSDDAPRAGDVPPPTALLLLDKSDCGPELDRRLGVACRRFPGRLIVWHQIPVVAGAGADPVSDERFFAFGFRRVFDLVAENVRHRVFEYRLSDYKQPPDWLNTRFWANPERFALDPGDHFPDGGGHRDAGDDDADDEYEDPDDPDHAPLDDP